MTKKFETKKQKKRKFFAERQMSALGKEVPLPSAKVGTRQRATFAERLTEGARQRATVYSAVALCRVLSFAERLALGKDVLCRVFLFAEGLALGKGVIAERILCREPGAKQRWPLPSAR